MNAFPNKQLIARMTAQMLLEINAVHFRADKPYEFTSGLASPVYTDCRKIISYPRIRSTLMDFAAARILSEIGFEQIDAIAGGETAGIPFAAWLADKLHLPMQYVRKKPKGFGLLKKWHGRYDSSDGQTVLANDACLLAEALDRALVSDDLEKKCKNVADTIEKALIQSLGDKPGGFEIDATVDESFIDFYREFIEFCRLGAFEIH